jgi:hypothetical protein
MLNGDFHEGHRMLPGLVPFFPGLNSFMSVHGSRALTPLRPWIPHISANSRPDVKHTERPNVIPMSGVARDLSVRRLAQTLPLQEKRYAERKKRKELLSV